MKKEYSRKIMPLESLYDIFIEQEDNYPDEQLKLDEKVKKGMVEIKENIDEKTKENTQVIQENSDFVKQV